VVRHDQAIAVAHAHARHPRHEEVQLGRRVARVLDLEAHPRARDHVAHARGKRRRNRAVAAHGAVTKLEVVHAHRARIDGRVCATPYDRMPLAPLLVDGDDVALHIEQKHARRWHVRSCLRETRRPRSVVAVRL
jgi:hypothetical protein